MKEMLLNNKENTVKTINEFLNTLFKSEVIKYLLYPRILDTNNVAFQCLTKNKKDFSDNGLFVPVMPVNSAKAISEFSFKNFNDKVGVLIRPCEAKAVIELIKLKQIDPENLVVITFDCLGIINPKDFQDELSAGKEITELREENIKKYTKGETLFEEKLRKSCSACISPVYESDIHIGLIGTEDSINITLKDEIYEKIKENIAGETEEPGVGPRKDLLGNIIKKKSLQRENIIKEFKGKVKNIDELLNKFSLCMRCYNCRTACPICYCRECIFDTKVFEHSPSTFKRWLEKKEAVKLPADTLLFHLTRLNHMSFSCVNCGYCSSACPNDLPVFELFLAVGRDVQKIFEYEPGRSVDDPIPLTEFKEEELKSVET